MSEQPSLYTRYAKGYVKSDVKTASGKRKSVDKGDRLAEALRGKSVEELIVVCSNNGIQAGRWLHLNPGRFRMQVGRALRMIIKSGTVVIVDGKRIEEL